MAHDEAAPHPSTAREGWDAPLDTDADRRAAVEAAFDYRGDVTVTTGDGRTFEGYVFDRRPDGDDPVFRLMLQDGGRQTLRYADLARLVFTGRDTAAGKSWETWVRKYAEAKAARVSDPGSSA